MKMKMMMMLSMTMKNMIANRDGENTIQPAFALQTALEIDFDF